MRILFFKTPPQVKAPKRMPPHRMRRYPSPWWRDRNKWSRGLLLVGKPEWCLFLIAIFLVFGDIRDFVIKIVLKDNNDAGRGDLYSLAIDYFNDGTAWEQFFGRGIETPREYFVDATDHGSIHNAYLQVLLYYGIAGFLFMVVFIFCRFVAALKLINKDRFVGSLSFGLVAFCATLMFTNTTILFTSPIDSFFLTAFSIVIPKYLENGLGADGGQK